MCAARPDESPFVLRRERRSAGVDEVGAPAVLRPAARRQQPAWQLILGHASLPQHLILALERRQLVDEGGDALVVRLKDREQLLVRGGQVGELNVKLGVLRGEVVDLLVSLRQVGGARRQVIVEALAVGRQQLRRAR